MVSIAIADDDLTVCAEIDTYLRTFFLSVKYKLDDYSDGSELIAAINDGNHYDIVFLDIEMRCYDGIKTGDLIRWSDPMENIYIVYVSSHEDNLIPLFRFHPFGFLSKPLAYADFHSVMTGIMSDMNTINLRIQVTIKRDTVYIPIREITYIESLGRKLIIHLCDNLSPIECYGKLAEILYSLNRLCDNFCQLHKSFVVNMLYIDRLNISFAVIQGTRIPVGRKYHSMIMMKQYQKILLPDKNEVR